MNDLSYLIVWWIWIVLIGITFSPITSLIFGKFFDKGFGLSKTVGILIISYLTFLLSISKIVPFNYFYLIGVFGALAGLNIYLFVKLKLSLPFLKKGNTKLILFEELLFALGLFFWTYVRSKQPDINGLEKLMDFGFVNSILKSDFFPPKDMWAAGENINYYWYGHFVTALLSKITSVPPGVSYNLMLGTILGLSLSSVFSLIGSLIFKTLKRNKIKAAILGGLISAVLVNFAGNFHTPYFVLKNGVDKYWYPDATRFIGYNPDVEDKTIHEFPIYSYVVSDLHAHLLNLPFVILFLSSLYGLISLKESENLKHTRTVFRLLFLGFLLGVMFMTNAWDLANYLLVAGISFIFVLKTKKSTFSLDNIVRIATYILVIIFAAILTSILFVLNFQSIAQGVAATHTKTPIWQLSILWGFPAVVTVMFVAGYLVSKKISIGQLFVLALLASSWILIFIPEFVYVKDIYTASHYRANTMFKLTYQAYVMTYIASGFCIVVLLSKIKKLPIRFLMSLVSAAVIASILYYPFLAVKSYYGEIFDSNNTSKGLSGDNWLKNKYPDTFETINWLKKNANKQEIILEAPGDSYTDYNVISSYTGLPTVSGWFVHEWLWRGSPEFPQSRVNDIAQIYTSDSIPLALSLLKKYKVSYVVIGSFEREKYADISETKFNHLGEIVYSYGSTKIYRIN